MPVPSLALAEPLFKEGVSRRAHGSGKFLVLLSLLIGTVFAVLLSSVSYTFGGGRQRLAAEEPMVTMVSSIPQQGAAFNPKAFSSKSHGPPFLHLSSPQQRLRGRQVSSASTEHYEPGTSDYVSRRAALAAATALAVAPHPAWARLEGVNKPDLLPKGEFTTVIDVAEFLTPGEEKKIAKLIKELETETGVKLRLLCQNYPETPGLAIREYWGVDADTVVLVADPGLGNLLNFNVGANVDLSVPRTFWTRLAGRYGTKKYWQDNTVEAAINVATGAINACVRDPEGKFGPCQSLDSGEAAFEKANGPSPFAGFR